MVLVANHPVIMSARHLFLAVALVIRRNGRGFIPQNRRIIECFGRKSLLPKIPQHQLHLMAKGGIIPGRGVLLLKRGFVKLD
jgi:hypothetical protein